MENLDNSANNHKQILSSTQPMFPPYPNFPPELTPTAPYKDTPQFFPYSGMPYLPCDPPPMPDMGYPQPFVPPTAGQSYYTQPTVVYPEPPDTKYPTATMQQEQQQLILTNNMPTGVTPVVVDRRAPVSMVGAIVLSSIVYCFCISVCGGIALMLAIVGRSLTAGDRGAAIHIRRASYGLSIAGIFTAVFQVAIYFLFWHSSGLSSEGSHDPWMDDD